MHLRRLAALGGHVTRCENDACGYTAIAYNSCLMGKIRNGESGATWRVGLAQGNGSAPRAISLAPHKILAEVECFPPATVIRSP